MGVSCHVQCGCVMSHAMWVCHVTCNVGVSCHMQCYYVIFLFSEVAKQFQEFGQKKKLKHHGDAEVREGGMVC